MSCPRREELLALVEGVGTDEVAAHVQSCARCKGIVDGLDRPDAELARLARTAPPGVGMEGEWEPAIEAMVRRGPNNPGDQAMTPRQLPCRMGNYELQARIGPKSGQGELYRARQLSMWNREVAVKVLRRDRCDADAQLRFTREILATGRLEHPNIVRAYDAGEAKDGTPFLVMELLRGPSVWELINQHGVLPIGAACEIVRQTAVGLDHAHRQGYIHRDIKPGNVMLSSLGEVKVLDLGLARPVTREGEAQTLPGTLMGTALYMAPEQFRDAASAGVPADLFGLGCLLFRLLTGRPPYGSDGMDVLGVMHAQMRGSLPDVRQYCPGVDGGLARLLEGLLRLDPGERRPATAAEVARQLLSWASRDQLEDLLGGRPMPNEAADSPSEIPSTESGWPQAGGDLTTVLDVLFWNGQRHVSITEPGALPVRAGTPFQIEVRLSEPAYAYLVWVSGEGRGQPLYPWSPGKWELKCEDRIDRLFRPARDANSACYVPWRIGGPTGVETVVLMVRRTPLPEKLRERLPGLFTGFPGPESLAHLAERERGHWFTHREAEPERERAVEFGGPPVEDPIFQIHSLLRDRLGSRFDVVQAISFVNMGPEGGTA